MQTTIVANYNLLRLKNESHSEQPSNQEDLQAAIMGVKTALTYNMTKAQFYYLWQFRLLIAGAILFISWRILEMVRISCLV